MRNSQFDVAVGPNTAAWTRLQQQLYERSEINESAGAPTAETLELLREFGLFHATIAADEGGWGIGLWQNRPLELWTINRRLGFADGSIAHCLQVHNNSADMIFDFASRSLKTRCVQVIKHGGILAAWGASRFDAPPWIARREGNDTYVVSGHAFFCTNAGFATHAVILVACPDEKDIPYNGLLVALIDVRQPGIKIIPDWWNKATGMIATASHRVELTEIRFHREDIVVTGHEVQKHAIQTRFMPQFASNFLGMIERMLSEARDVTARSKSVDALTRSRLGRLSVLAARIEGLMRETARIWIEEPQSSPWMANVYRSEAGHALVEAMDHAGILLGGAGMMNTFAFPRIVRNAMTMLRHENTDRILDTLGSLCLGSEQADVNYSGRVPVKA